MIFDSYCVNQDCGASGIPVEHFYHNSAQPMNDCAVCHGPTEKITASRFAVVFTGVISARYLDSAAEGAHQRDGSHWAYEKDAAGKTHAVRIETFDQQRDFCKRNKLANPKDLGRHNLVAEDGKTTLSPMGLPGVEV